jgi:hypothetical protein
MPKVKDHDGKATITSEQCSDHPGKDLPSAKSKPE